MNWDDQRAKHGAQHSARRRHGPAPASATSRKPKKSPVARRGVQGLCLGSRPREDLCPVWHDEQRVFRLRREPAVRGDGGPLVLPLHHAGAALREDGLYREGGVDLRRGGAGLVWFGSVWWLGLG